NKRITDIMVSLMIIILYPLLLFTYKNASKILSNALDVFMGKKTWVGYTIQRSKLSHLPLLRQPILPPYQIIEGYAPEEDVLEFLSKRYASEYDSLDDLRIIWNNRKYLYTKT